MIQCRSLDIREFARSSQSVKAKQWLFLIQDIVSFEDFFFDQSEILFASCYMRITTIQGCGFSTFIPLQYQIVTYCILIDHQRFCSPSPKLPPLRSCSTLASNSICASSKPNLLVPFGPDLAISSSDAFLSSAPLRCFAQALSLVCCLDWEAVDF